MCKNRTNAGWNQAVSVEALNVSLSRSDVVSLLHRDDENASIADFAGSCGLHAGFDDALDHFIGKDNLDHDFGEKRNAVLRSSVDGFVALLTPVSAHFRHRHAGHVHRGEALLNLFKFLVTNDDLQKLHVWFLGNWLK